MIPTTSAITTTTSSSSSSSLSGNQNFSSAMLGIASLILEGRAISDDDFILPMNPQTLFELQQQRSSFNIIGSHFGNETTPSNSNDSTVQDVQRLREKLGQLRQSSPSTSRDHFPLGEQKISIGSNLAYEMEALLPDVAEDDIYSGYGTNKKHHGASGSSGSSSYFKSSEHHQPEKLLCSLQSLASTCLRTTPRGFHRNIDLTSENWVHGANKLPSPLSNFSSNYFPSKNQKSELSASNLPSNFTMASSATSKSSRNGSQTSPRTSSGECYMDVAINMKSVRSVCSEKNLPAKMNKIITAPKMGPHCDQFLKKLGLSKNDASDAEEHICDMSYNSDICYRWQQYCLEMQAITSCCEPVCIDVYLGPKSHQILLEQWIIEHKDKVTTPNMTLQALCNAIHSQLYFSQITAWCDLIRNSGNNEHLMATGRVQYIKSILKPQQLKPRLDIFYRIRKYDSTASFNAKPNIHNFPNVVIAENLSISVCLKSLPRIHGGIPIICEVQEVFDTTTTIIDIIKKPLTESNGNSTSSIAINSNSVAVAVALAVHCIPETDRIIIDNNEKQEELIVDEQMPMEWIDKHGKHKCLFDDDDVSSDATTIGDNSCPANSLDHRERQLMKYKKRMMKRDKKTKKPDECDSMTILSTIEMVADENGDPNSCCQPMQLEDKFNNSTSNVITINNGQHQPLPEYGSINSIRPPLYQTVINTVTESVQTNSVEMISTGTQTANFPMLYPPCNQCGTEMSIVCFNCDNLTTVNQLNDDVPSSPPQKLGKAEMLLQAIQRTPKIKTKNHNNNSKQSPAKIINSNGVQCQQTRNQSQADIDCSYCKRQKTQHHYRRKEHPQRDDMMVIQQQFNNNNNNNNYKNVNVVQSNQCLADNKCNKNSKNSENSDCNCHILSKENFSLDQNNQKLSESPPITAIKCHNNDSNNLTLLLPNGKSTPSSAIMISPTAQFKTPTMSMNIINAKPPNLIKSSHHHLNVYNKQVPKVLPKVNLTQLFCGGIVGGNICGGENSPLLSSPIPIGSGMTPEAFTFDNIKIDGNPEIPVQKSNSAPTLPNSPSLSPRFTKQAAFYNKRRSRHYSDRSDRSSLGSDEQISDEDLDGTYSPATSPIKNRLFAKSSLHVQRPMLGNLEESLMQKRFRPKVVVMGFKVLLGASGSFCPTQLPLPAATYFYELTGQSLSTPYLSEVRLPRKGYTIPRTGTVQATLLNPEGTVVRMFVIPYDFSDMPPMHHTFIRQRILAVDNETAVNNSLKVNKNNMEMNGSNVTTTNYKILPFNMQMRLLRYSIHLRFQTSRSGRLVLYNDIRLLISRRTDCDTAAAHAKGALESQNELKIETIIPDTPKYSARQENQSYKI